ncbi:MAG: cupin domain-containing protein [Candidatus Latescibacteria bacterium]|nr:cupin domain-containing protein [Candidatus Latescibacterota bacterium]
MQRLITLTFISVLFFQAPASAQDERLVPSYDEKSQYIYDHPDVDINVYPFVNTWKNSDVQVGHGGFVEQTIFTRGNPVDPPTKGAVLKYIRSYNHGFLYGNEKTEPIKHDREQVIFYITRGAGTVEAGDKSSEISEGTGIFIPAGLEYSFTNASGVALEVIIIVEEIPEDFKPKKDMVVKSYYDAIPGHCCWAYTTYSLFGRNDGLAEPMGLAVVAVESYGMGSPHYHVEGCEEIWLKLKGEENSLLLGKKLLRQNIGEAFLAPPNGLVPHSVINHTESPMAWLYLGNRHDR